jgi:hypothetical protein
MKQFEYTTDELLLEIGKLQDRETLNGINRAIESLHRQYLGSLSLDELIEHYISIKPEGFTFDCLNTLIISPNYGYFVGVESVQFTELSSLACVYTGLIGVWYDRESNTTFIDKTVHLTNLSEALALGRTLGQLAIWDCAKGKEIRIN